MAMSLALHNVSFVLDNGQTLFKEINFSLTHRVNALVGNNGVGKSVLAQLMAQRLPVSNGVVLGGAMTTYVPQLWPGSPTATVKTVLGLEEPLNAIDRIESGEPQPDDFAVAESWWDWPVQLQAALKTTGFEFNLDLARSIQSFSGGEQFRLSWAAAILTGADVFILDEPTNHLDQNGRERLTEWISNSRKKFIVVSHDRTFLHSVDAIYELTPDELHIHPGSYSAYFARKRQRWESQSEALSYARKVDKRAKSKAQDALEKQQQRVASGKARATRKNWSIIERNAAKEAGEKNLKSQKILREHRASDAGARVRATASEREWFEPVAFSLPASRVSKNKAVLSLKNLTIGFQEPISKPLSIQLKGPFCLHITGSNGSGKSALIKTIIGEISPIEGTAQTHVDSAYLDQHFTEVLQEKSAIENVCLAQPGLCEKEGRDRLAWLRLRNTKAEVPFGKLSAGEQLKVALVSKLLGHHTPQLLILDEPTNHLDLDSVIALEKALEAFEGAMILVSHDAQFAEKQHITHILNMETGKLILR
jgi:ATPase subunit of ABC transporter with duplicated ATPase domains